MPGKDTLHKDPTGKKVITRRQFIKSTAAGTAAIYAAPTVAFGTKGYVKSRVANVSNEDLTGSFGSINKKSARGCTDQALLLLTRKENIKDAWMQLFPNLNTGDTIGIKVNAVSYKCPTHPEIVVAAAQSLSESLGFNPNNIIIWDRADSDLKRAGYELNKSEKGIRCFGTVKRFDWERWMANQGQNEYGGIGYDKEQPVSVGNGKTSLLSKIITRMCTHLINMPVLKHHNLTGVSLSLKNHYGSIDNPKDCHANFCDPHIAKLNAAPQIKNKTRLIICDAAYGLYSGGPMGAPQFKQRSVLAATDPVALDVSGMDIINARRQENGKEPVTNKAVHLQTADRLALGTNNPDQIEVVEKKLA